MKLWKVGKLFCLLSDEVAVSGHRSFSCRGLTSETVSLLLLHANVKFGEWILVFDGFWMKGYCVLSAFLIRGVSSECSRFFSSVTRDKLCSTWGKWLDDCVFPFWKDQDLNGRMWLCISTISGLFPLSFSTQRRIISCQLLREREWNTRSVLERTFVFLRVKSNHCRYTFCQLVLYFPPLSLNLWGARHSPFQWALLTLIERE